MKNLTAIFLILSSVVTNEAFALTANEQVERQLLLIQGAVMTDGYDNSTHNNKVDSLNKGDTGNYYFNLNSSKRYMIVGVCDKDCNDLDFTLYDENDHQVAKDVKTDGTPVIKMSPSWTGKFKLKVKMYNCSANPCSFGISVFSKDV